MLAGTKKHKKQTNWILSFLGLLFSIDHALTIQTLKEDKASLQIQGENKFYKERVGTGVVLIGGGVIWDEIATVAFLPFLLGNHRLANFQTNKLTKW